MKTYILLALVLVACSKQKTTTQDLVENKRWFCYKEVRPNDTLNMNSRQYWFEARGGIFTDYDRYRGTYQIKRDTLLITFTNGTNVYYIERITPDNLILVQKTAKSSVNRKLYFDNGK